MRNTKTPYSFMVAARCTPADIVGTVEENNRKVVGIVHHANSPALAADRVMSEQESKQHVDALLNKPPLSETVQAERRASINSGVWGDGPWVLNKHHPWSRDLPAVYVGRGSDYGNPFPITKEHDRATVIAMHKAWLKKQLTQFGGARRLRLLVTDLQGRNLRCFCAPLPCHAEVLREIANSPNPQLTVEKL
jgi:hypothetical protein